jgi:hypothetical protein
MKRVLTAAASAVVLVLTTAATAFAQDSGYGAGDVGSGVAGAGGSTAFTGGDVTTGIFVAFALVAIGVTALLIARRSAAKVVA